MIGAAPQIVTPEVRREIVALRRAGLSLSQVVDEIGWMHRRRFTRAAISRVATLAGLPSASQPAIERVRRGGLASPFSAREDAIVLAGGVPAGRSSTVSRQRARLLIGRGAVASAELVEMLGRRTARFVQVDGAVVAIGAARLGVWRAVASIGDADRAVLLREIAARVGTSKEAAGVHARALCAGGYLRRGERGLHVVVAPPAEELA